MLMNRVWIWVVIGCVWEILMKDVGFGLYLSEFGRCW